MMAMTWAAGDSQSERFEIARGFYVSCFRARRRPGKSIQGFQKALGRIPMRQLRVFAAGVRRRIHCRLGTRRLIDGFEPMGCDGSRIECPRTAELEARLGCSGNDGSAPAVWLTAFVHLPTGLLWSWRLGPGVAAEQMHLRQLLATLSPEALIVCDAAYMGFDLVRAILGSRRSFLFRMSSRIHLHTLENTPLADWTEGSVLYWPTYAQRKGLDPIRCRLIRVPGKIAQTKTKTKRNTARRDVWLLTDILDSSRLSSATASQFYCWRWRNEGVFRTYKRTINKLKLSGRSLRLVHREAELSLLATQILLAHADVALRPITEPIVGEPVSSPRKVLIEIRREMKAIPDQRGPSYQDRLRACGAEKRKQKSAKAIREWPRRKPHESPRPPILHPLSEKQKKLLDQELSVAT
jgi:hypothetical protein